MVEIVKANIEPKWGLYNGAIGTVVDIVYHQGENRNNGHLPKVVVVDVSTTEDPSGTKITLHMFQLLLSNGDVKDVAAQGDRSHYKYHGLRQYSQSRDTMQGPQVQISLPMLFKLLFVIWEQETVKL
jgi:hypothetical protein